MDGDGRVDLFITYFGRNVLYRNLGQGRFADVTVKAGLDAGRDRWGSGCSLLDVDRDGDLDLFVANYLSLDLATAPEPGQGPNCTWKGLPVNCGPKGLATDTNLLYRNNGDGTFTDVSKASGTDHRSWSVSAAFVDVDRDGWLDLYVGNYLRYSLQNTSPCFSATGSPDYCAPGAYQPLPDRLYINRRDGTFADASVTSGISREFGPALGVSTADFNGDGWIDIYVANDGKENLLWINKRNGTFENAALLSGVALPVSAKAEGSMGVDAGDFDDDGDEDLVMTELTSEGSNLYVNDGHGLFTDVSTPSMLGPASLALTGFGTGWFDYDNDGRLDLLAVNGTVQIIESLRQAHDPFPMHQKKLLLHNVGGGRLEDVTARAGRAFALSEVGRGAAFGDVDNDGDVDVLIGNNNGPVRLLINEAARGRHWVGMRVVSGFSRNSATSVPRDMLGARVEIVRNGKRSLWRRARADGSYASASDPRVLAGLGDASDPVAVRVRWPDGRAESWSDVPIDRYTTLREGEGK